MKIEGRVSRKYGPQGVFKFFPFRADPSSKGTLCAEKQTESHKSFVPCKNGRKSGVSSPFKISLTFVSSASVVHQWFHSDNLSNINK